MRLVWRTRREITDKGVGNSILAVCRVCAAIARASQYARVLLLQLPWCSMLMISSDGLLSCEKPGNSLAY